ncbi:manganese/iron ABC transporter ATP-binding protein [Gilliamella sp. Pra-s65]|uniref:manganese/iron ABC transporter ATP-binding protein n=1 Tax=unclassified Gilliamella TaxID=2685620 RepID=UPI0013280297|nr:MULTISPECIES: manganese/iron ABC transporter ATP-binding protein [unclassified Gilliamella]MWN31280.1 manganese/iron ABC transporter ATP-binding protein [Gilliamella sp. Pra-s60]MWN90647.1 manganese/iron ABC transporter ATP-binding protein [Gilliamella sp. Pra-s65]MWP29112.1 manganese/iron ABC transporter ATP-binding protein [Gilliamella sp. Pra-s54]MWP46575.1 manganese/iron ABC transporter ATP-binding protein [Gilliamella sp. Pas-s27]MWP73709.1 manganese/iron ABC transporter ATP-binding pr
MTQICLNVNDITVTYNNGHTAIHDASFHLNGGTICALVGVNGSGKSTLFKSIMGMVKPTRGRVTFNDMSVNQALKQNIIAYVPQTEDVDWDFPVLVSDVVMMGRYGHMSFLRIASKEDKKQVDIALERVNMLDFKHRQIGELSGGQKKRVFLARALAQQGNVLLLDEPFTGVDVKTENAIIDLLKNLRAEGHLILVSTHNLGSVPEFCDQVVLINQTVLAFGPTETTFTPQNLMTTFGGALRYLSLSGDKLHEDEDPRKVSILTDDERAAIFYGEGKHDSPHQDLLVNHVENEQKRPK